MKRGMACFLSVGMLTVGLSLSARDVSGADAVSVTEVSTGVLEKVECFVCGGGKMEKRWNTVRRRRADFEVALIADVENVAIVSREAPDGASADDNGVRFRPGMPSVPYRIELSVRQVVQGSYDAERIVFVVDPRQHLHFLEMKGTGWPFFHGVTLRVGLCREGEALKVAGVDLVLPYPPYTEATSLCPDYPISRFVLNPQAAARPKGSVASLYVQYGAHTLAKFYATTNDVSDPSGKLPDYSSAVRVEVWTASEGANADYWRTVRFCRDLAAETQPQTLPSVSVRNVEEGLDAETLLAFAWYDRHLGSGDLVSVKTLGAFADLVNERVVCKICARPHYRLMVPEELRTRAVRFDDEAYGRVLDLLDGVCERTGCVRTLRGQEVVLVSEVSDVELSDKSLRGRLSILEKDGFVSVMGAEYVKFSSFGSKSRNGRESPYYCPYTFWSDTAYVTTGNGWRRKDADGNEEYLVYDADWWTAEEWKRRGYGFSPYEAKTRLARDAAKVRSALLDAAEAPGDRVAARLSLPEIDAFALAFALHLQQFGRDDDAQSIYDALCLRPAAAEAAFAKLRQRVKLGRRQKGR